MISKFYEEYKIKSEFYKIDLISLIELFIAFVLIYLTYIAILISNFSILFILFLITILISIILVIFKDNTNKITKEKKKIIELLKKYSLYNKDKIKFLIDNKEQYLYYNRTNYSITITLSIITSSLIPSYLKTYFNFNIEESIFAFIIISSILIINIFIIEKNINNYLIKKYNTLYLILNNIYVEMDNDSIFKKIINLIK